MRYSPSLLAALAAAACLASCGGSTSDANDQATEAAEPHLDIAIDPMWQQKRLQACMKRMGYYQKLGVWKLGGGAPLVSRAGWDKLTPAEKDEIFEIGACIAGAGEMGERMVTVAEEGGGPEIETARVISDRDFAKELSESESPQ